MAKEIEKRVTSGKVSLRSAPAGSDSPGTLMGYAAVFNILSNDLGGFKETIKPGAFDRVLKTKPDVRFLANHDPSLVLGRTKSGTLTLSADDVGLWFECQLPDTQTAKDIRTLCGRGDMDECSFAFRLEDGDDSFSKGATVTRTISNFSHLFDASIVTYPAYPGTSASARSLGTSASAPRIDYRASATLLDEAIVRRIRARAAFLGVKIAYDDENATERAQEILRTAPDQSWRIWLP